jgi:hypothetical protein
MAIDDIVPMDAALKTIERIMGRRATDENASPDALKRVKINPANIDILYLTAKKMIRGIEPGKLKYYFYVCAKPVEEAYIAGDVLAFKKAMRNFAISIYSDL